LATNANIQELPTIVADDNLLPGIIVPASAGQYCVMTAPVEHIKLIRIVSLILRDLYAIRPPGFALRIDLSSKYTSELHSWRHALALFLDDDRNHNIESYLLIPIYQRQRSVLNLAYYHAMLLIHRPFLLSNFASLTHMPTHSTFNASIDTSSNISTCLDAAMSIVRVVDDVFKSSNLFRSFWFTQYYAFCAVVVLYIYRIQQHLVTPGKCEGYFSAGMKCQRQLESVSETDCLARRYCLVLEELRLEAVRQVGKVQGGTVQFGPANVDTLPPFATETTPTENPYYANMLTPESAVLGNGFLPDSSIMADLTSWGQFDSLVTAGIGLFDGAGMQGDGGFGFGFGM
jgi:hypothetical protein